MSPYPGREWPALVWCGAYLVMPKVISSFQFSSVQFRSRPARTARVVLRDAAVLRARRVCVRMNTRAHAHGQAAGVPERAGVLIDLHNVIISVGNTSLRARGRVRVCMSVCVSVRTRVAGGGDDGQGVMECCQINWPATL